MKEKCSTFDMPQYAKISSIFKRDNTTNKLIQGDYASDLISLLRDIEWTATEKLDGTNVRIGFDGLNSHIRGRTDNAVFHPGLLFYLKDKFQTPEALSLLKSKFTPEVYDTQNKLMNEADVVMYGEGIGAKIQADGGLYGPIQFVLFDVKINGRFVKRETVEVIAAFLGVQSAPVVIKGHISRIAEYVTLGPLSTIALHPKQLEGVVIRPDIEVFDVYGNRAIFKLKCRDFIKVS